MQGEDKNTQASVFSELINGLALTLAFFSRIPLPEILGKRISPSVKLSAAAGLFPVAGLVIAIPPAIIWYVASLVLPSAIAAGLTLLAATIITGGLHEDGFADCADGLGGAFEKERVLEIMRDSRIGTYGGIALIFTLGLRWAALATFTSVSGVLAILIAYTGSRAAMTLAMQFSNYARKEGLGAQAKDISRYGCLIAIIISIGIALIAGQFAGIIALVTGLLAAWIFLKYLEGRIGGYTGDGLGAMQQICEITIFITLAGFWS